MNPSDQTNPFEEIPPPPPPEERGEILYCALGYKEKILSNFSLVQLGDLSPKVHEVINSLPSKATDQNSVKYRNYNINTVKDNEGVFALCVTHAVFPLNESLHMLRQLIDQFSQQYSISKMESSNVFGISSFNKEIKNKVIEKNDYDNHRLAKIRRDQEETTAILNEDITKLLDRGDALDQLTDESTYLVQSSETFTEKATDLKKTMRCRFWKLWIIIILIVVIILAILAVWCGCGLYFDRCIALY